VARGNRWPQRRVEPPELTARRAGCYTPRFDDEDTVARKDDEAPDPTLGPHITPVNIGGDSILDRLAPHVMKFAVGAGALVVVIIAYYSWRWYDRSKAEKATSTLVRGLELGDRAVVAEPTPEDTEPSYPSYAARADATAAAIAKSGRALAAPRRSTRPTCCSPPASTTRRWRRSASSAPAPATTRCWRARPSA
jgi:hypothetical protein